MTVVVSSEGFCSFGVSRVADNHCSQWWELSSIVIGSLFPGLPGLCLPFQTVRGGDGDVDQMSTLHFEVGERRISKPITFASGTAIEKPRQYDSTAAIGGNDYSI